ncbi:tripartite tricarboxylate transporter substrate-binding protein [Aromatoleum diolicum]|uniref:Tripartite tricarboxylate transporter substrate binding protein BugD n=1 Tax=Aromatoleum diolicum TaxID=75796 RepID=A0ABX1Q8H4_9RHOO|nr:tripartite tricarboxylate transporter substrate-binding protein [Aromatoleum diolicum]NMG74661.1 tripartite tricarboxylate transporter substrate binding protein BugD [Aromatoleum diolicum]
MSQIVRRAVAVVSVFIAVGAFAAQPDPKVTLVVPFVADGPTDHLAQPLAAALGRALGERVMVKNIGGGGGSVGTRQVQRSRPDGSVLLLANVGHATAPALNPKLSYDPQKDFAPIGLVADVPMTLIGRRELRAHTLPELLTQLDKGRRKLTYGHAGAGSASHLCGVLFARAADRKVAMLTYPGTANAMTAMLSDGHVDLMCDQTSNTLARIKAGEVQAYGVTTAERLPALPDVPTLAEAGLPGVDVLVWHGLYAPKDTPPEVVDRLTKALQQALQDPALQSALQALGTQPVSAERATPKALRERLAADIERWGKTLK